MNTQNPRVAVAIDLLSMLERGEIRFRRAHHFESAQDFSFYSNLINSIIRFKRKFLFLIHKLTGTKIQELDPEVVVSLLVGLAQLDESSRVDDFAAVNESVDLVSTLGKSRLKGFVNANLRTFIRDRDKLLKNLNQQSLAVRSSHEDWMVKRWVDHFGKRKTQKFCQANNLVPQLNIIINPKLDITKTLHQLESLGFRCENILERSYRVENPKGFFETDLTKNGAFIIQDPAFQQIVQILGKLPKKSVLDACAAPGGKLFHLEWAFGEEIDRLVALESNEKRLQRLQENCLLYKSRAELHHMDAGNNTLKDKYDLVIVDAPCSGTAIIRKHPEIKWKRKAEDFVKNNYLQLAILDGVAKNTKTGGHLAYITCSLEKEENEDVVNNFLKDHPEFNLIPLQSPVTVADDLFYCLPNKLQMGAFGALFQKQ
ncbi:MAG: hypothetical protein GY786_22925 [Proteobacteria bacterium]|nr:hypothetical protein [Pseudomonadota bacterium]